MFPTNQILIRGLALLALSFLSRHWLAGCCLAYGSSIGPNQRPRSSLINKHALDQAAPLARFSWSSLLDFKQNPFQSRPEQESSRSSGCGRRVKRFTDRIVGGRRAAINNYPWMVSLQREKGGWYGMKAYYHSCGGSLITNSWIVTAAHCLYNRDEPIRLVAGTDNLNQMGLAQTRGVARQVMHPNFNITTYDNDIALVKAERAFNLDSSYLAQVGPVCLSPEVPIVAYDIGSICGFGSRSFQAKTRAHLYETQIAIVDRATCEESFEGAVTGNMICAGGMIANRRDACSGDSGGPLTLDLDRSGRQVLAGVVSFGQDCARAHFPGIYTNVKLYYKWILDNIDEPLESV